MGEHNQKPLLVIPHDWYEPLGYKHSSYTHIISLPACPLTLTWTCVLTRISYTHAGIDIRTCNTVRRDLPHIYTARINLPNINT